MIRSLLVAPFPLLMLAACGTGSPAADTTGNAATEASGNAAAATDGGYAQRIEALSPRDRAARRGVPCGPAWHARAPWP